MEVDKENILPENHLLNNLNLHKTGLNNLLTKSANVHKTISPLATLSVNSNHPQPNSSQRPALQSLLRSKSGGAQRVSARRVSANPMDDDDDETPSHQIQQPSVSTPISASKAAHKPQISPSLPHAPLPTTSPQPKQPPHQLHPQQPQLQPPQAQPQLLQLPQSTQSQAQPTQSHPRFIVNNNEYRILSQIGRGGTSKVYRVENSSNQQFALKRIDIKVDDPLYESLKNEIELLKKVQGNPYIIQLYEYEEIDLDPTEGTKLLLIVLELGQGDLHSFLSRQAQQKAKLSIKQLRYLWQSMLLCVLACHRQNIIHLDLKPSNFVFVENRLKLIDFGIAKCVKEGGTSVITESQVGTLNYMSPESLEDSNSNVEENDHSMNTDNHNCNPRQPEIQKSFKMRRSSDVWSLGIILYQCIYGKPPFAEITNLFRKMKAIIDPTYVISFPPFDLHEMNQGIQMDIYDLMKTCLQRESLQRPSIEALLQHRFLRKSSYLSSHDEILLTKVMKLVNDTTKSELQSLMNKLRNGDLMLE